jgi:hypothetical protein
MKTILRIYLHPVFYQYRDWESTILVNYRWAVIIPTPELKEDE